MTPTEQATVTNANLAIHDALCELAWLEGYLITRRPKNPAEPINPASIMNQVEASRLLIEKKLATAQLLLEAL